MNKQKLDARAGGRTPRAHHDTRRGELKSPLICLTDRGRAPPSVRQEKKRLGRISMGIMLRHMDKPKAHVRGAKPSGIPAKQSFAAEKPETMIRADSRMCYKCGKEKAHRWISVDPDIRPIAYCVNCLMEFENKLRGILK